MKTIHKVGLSMLVLILATAGIYAAGQQITSLTQTVTDGDIMTSQYYNNLNGPKSEGKVCKMSGGKLVCLDDAGTGGGGGGGGRSALIGKTIGSSGIAWPNYILCDVGGNYGRIALHLLFVGTNVGYRGGEDRKINFNTDGTFKNQEYVGAHCNGKSIFDLIESGQTGN